MFVKNKKKIFVIILLFIILTSLALRLYSLTADPPLILEIVREEAAKAYEARNKVLFGQWEKSEYDNYNFWRYQSPVWVYSLVGLFKLFGVGFLQTRLLSIIFYALSIIPIYLFLKKAFSDRTALIAIFGFGFNFFYLAHTRMGIMEPMLLFFLILTFYLLYRSLYSWKYFIFACLVFILAIAVKMTALYFTPLLLLVFFNLLKKNKNRLTFKNRLAVVILLFVIVISSLVFVLLNQRYLTRVIVQLRHVFIICTGMCQYNVDEGVPINFGLLINNIIDYFSLFNLYDNLIIFIPIILPLALLEMLSFIYYKEYKKKENISKMMIIVWFILSLFTLMIISISSPRFTLIIFPSVIMLAALMVERIIKTRLINSMYKKQILVNILVLFLFINLGQYFIWVKSRTYYARDASKQVIELLEKEEENLDTEVIVLGKIWTGPLLLESNFKYYFYRPNLDKDQLHDANTRFTNSNITYILVGEDKFSFNDIFNYEAISKYKLWNHSDILLYRAWPKE